MILQCEACNTRFQVLGLNVGQTVRCGRCRHTWAFGIEKPMADMPPVPVTDDTSGGDADIPMQAAGAEEVPELSARPNLSPERLAAIRVAALHRAGVPRWITALSAALFLVVCALGVLDFMPMLFGFHPSEGLVFQSLVFQRNGDKAYMLTGTIMNKTAEPMHSPQLALYLLDGQGREVRIWRRSLPATTLIEPGGRVNFAVNDLEATQAIEDPHIRVELGNSLELALRRAP